MCRYVLFNAQDKVNIVPYRMVIFSNKIVMLILITNVTDVCCDNKHFSITYLVMFSDNYFPQVNTTLSSYTHILYRINFNLYFGLVLEKKYSQLIEKYFN